MFPTTLKNFARTENWGDPDKMDHTLLEKLDEYRARIGVQIYVSCGTQGVHEPHSLHYEGKAVDCLILSRSINVLDLLFPALQIGFSEIGYYPDWKYYKHNFPGFHFGYNETSTRTKLWIREKSKTGIIQSAINTENLKRLGII